jgi:glutaredoxin
MDVVIYCRNGCQESEVMREYLKSLGLDYRLKSVDGDDGARREWEDLDGQVTPLLLIDQRQIVRGMDRARIDQLIGWIGC